MARKRTNSNSLRDRLASNLLAAVEADFGSHPEVIETLRVQEPSRYADLLSKLIAAAEDPADPLSFKDCESMTDIGRKLLLGVGYSDPSEEAIAAAVAANNKFVAELEAIAKNEQELAK